jgi:hypothetical protein
MTKNYYAVLAKIGKAPRLMHFSTHDKAEAERLAKMIEEFTLIPHTELEVKELTPVEHQSELSKINDFYGIK